MSALRPGTSFGVVVVEADADRRQRLASLLCGGVDTTALWSMDDLQRELDLARPVVVVLGPSCTQPGQLERLEWLTRSSPELAVILVVDELSTVVLQRALRAGVKDVLASPDRVQLTWAVERVVETLEAGATSATPVTPPAIDTPGRVTTVFSTKGGSGTSVVAANLAVVLARRSPGTVALVDADLQFGDVAVMLKTTLQHTIADAAAAGDRLDPAMLQSLMVRHDASGLLVLPAPVEPSLAERIGADHVCRIVEVLRTFCDHVVIDTASRFGDVELALLDSSDAVVLVSGMEVPGIKNLKLAVETLHQLEVPASKLTLVLVHADTRVQLDVRGIERALGLGVAVVVPHDTAVPVSVNNCVPVVLDAPRSAVTRALEALADAVLPTSKPVRRRRRLAIPGRT